MLNWIGVAFLQFVNIPAFIAKIETGATPSPFPLVLTIAGLLCLFVDSWKHNEKPFILHLGIGIVCNSCLLVFAVAV